MSAHQHQYEHAGAQWLLEDPGDEGEIRTGYSGVVPLVTTTAGGETRTLPAPTYAGQWIMLVLKTDGGDCVVTCATTVNQTGNTTITFDDAGEYAKLEAAPVGTAILWRILANYPETEGPALG